MILVNKKDEIKKTDEWVVKKITCSWWWCWEDNLLKVIKTFESFIDVNDKNIKKILNVYFNENKKTHKIVYIYGPKILLIYIYKIDGEFSGSVELL